MLKPALLLSVTFFAIAADTLTAPVEFKQRADQIEVMIGNKPFTTYYFGSAVAKAYLMPLQTAHELVITRPFPVGNNVSSADRNTPSFEPHQRPLYFAHGDIDGLNFWAEAAFQKYYGSHSRQAYGHMGSPKIEEVKGGPESGKIQVTFLLEGPSDETIGEETQTFSFKGDDRTRIIDCDFKLYASNGPMVMGDTKEGTFGIRLGPDLSAPRGHMINSHGAEGEPQIWGKSADWVNYYGTVSNQDVGIAVFEHPKSFRHPTTWHARAYGLLAANPFGLREFTKDPNKDGSWTIPEGESLQFRYRVLIYDGKLSADQISSAYHEYSVEQ